LRKAFARQQDRAADGAARQIVVGLRDLRRRDQRQRRALEQLALARRDRLARVVLQRDPQVRFSHLGALCLDDVEQAFHQ
jgi:hypothetical protein